MFDRGYAGHQRRQLRLGFEMSPVERLAWLERKKIEVRKLLGKARVASKK